MSKHAKLKSFTSETAKRARAGQAVPPHLTHGLSIIARTGGLPCRPTTCPRASDCPSVAKDPGGRCEALAQHLTRFSTNLRKTAGENPVGGHLVSILLRREATLWALELYFSAHPAVRVESGIVDTAPALKVYLSTLREQETGLRALGTSAAAVRPNASQVFADALHNAIDATPKAQDGPGSHNGDEASS